MKQYLSRYVNRSRPNHVGKLKTSPSQYNSGIHETTHIAHLIARHQTISNSCQSSARSSNDSNGELLIYGVERMSRWNEGIKKDTLITSYFQLESKSIVTYSLDLGFYSKRLTLRFIFTHNMIQTHVSLSSTISPSRSPFPPFPDASSRLAVSSTSLSEWSDLPLDDVSVLSMGSEGGGGYPVYDGSLQSTEQ